MLEHLERQDRLTGNQWRIIATANLGDMLDFFDFFLIGYVLAFIIGSWQLTFGQSALILLASGLGAVPINGATADSVATLQKLTSGKGVDVSLELVGLPITMQQSVRALAIKGRAALVGITDKNFPLSPYHELINKEAEVIGKAETGNADAEDTDDVPF